MQALHPDRSALSRLAAGGLEGRPLIDLLEHLAACPDCSARFGREVLTGPGTEVSSRAPATGDAPPSARYGRVLDQATHRVVRLAGRFDRERTAAARGVAYLLALTDRERRRTVLADPRLQTWAVAREALDLSERSRTEDPSVAEELSALALAIAEHLPRRVYGRAVLEDLRSEIWAAIGNARRIRGHLGEAGAAFELARGHSRSGTGDPLESAELANLYGTYLRDSDRIDAARTQYDEAVGFYRDLGDRHLEGRTLISRALLERRVGCYDDAMVLLESATRFVDPAREPRLIGAVHQNRAHVLADLGEPERGLRALDAWIAEPAHRDRGRLDRLRTLWLRALLLERVDRRSEARRAFLGARGGFERSGLPVEVALLDLALARLALDGGERDEARRLASVAFPVLAARQLASETILALDLFRAAGGA